MVPIKPTLQCQNLFRLPGRTAADTEPIGEVENISLPKELQPETTLAAQAKIRSALHDMDKLTKGFHSQMQSSPQNKQIERMVRVLRVLSDIGAHSNKFWSNLEGKLAKSDNISEISESISEGYYSADLETIKGDPDLRSALEEVLWLLKKNKLKYAKYDKFQKASFLGKLGKLNNGYSGWAYQYDKLTFGFMKILNDYHFPNSFYTVCGTFVSMCYMVASHLIMEPSLMTASETLLVPAAVLIGGARLDDYVQDYFNPSSVKLQDNLGKYS